MLKSFKAIANQLTIFPAQHYPTVVGYMSNIKDVIVNKSYSGNFSDLFNPMSVAFTVKEHHSQFGKLLKDIEHANEYRIKFSKYLKDIAEDEEAKYYCSLPYLKQVFKEFSDFIDEFKIDSDIHKQLLKQQKDLNDVVKMYNDVKDPETLKEAATAAYGRMNFRSWPAWYRTELAAQVNRMNMALDEVLYEMNLKVSTKVCELSKPKGKTPFVPPPPRISRRTIKRIEKAQLAWKIMEERAAAVASATKRTDKPKSSDATSPNKTFAVTSKKSSSQKSRNNQSRKKNKK